MIDAEQSFRIGNFALSRRRMTMKRTGRPTSPILPSSTACTIRLGFQTPAVHLPFLRHGSAVLEFLSGILVPRFLIQIVPVDTND